MEGDDGRFEVTGNETDKGKFRTSGLRGIADTAPYMHDGSLATLEDVVNYYNTGGGTHPNKSELMKPLNLTQEEVSYLVAFLESMSGEIPMAEKPELPQ
jgi:cytochrome c peroxidase